jgi:hypothetical protein
MAAHPPRPAGQSYFAATLTILLILVPALTCAQASTIEHAQRLDGDFTGRAGAPSGWRARSGIPPAADRRTYDAHGVSEGTAAGFLRLDNGADRAAPKKRKGFVA